MNAVNNKTARWVCVELGSNIEPATNIPQAVEYLEKVFSVGQVSHTWETEPVGCVGCENYLNAAILIHTPLSAEALKVKLREIECHLGRVRTSNKFAPRTIDLDTLVIGDKIIEADLWEYAHLAVPVAELLPDLVNPASGERLDKAARRLMQQTMIRLREDVALHIET